MARCHLLTRFPGRMQAAAERSHVPALQGKTREQEGSREGKGSMGSNGVALIGKSKPCLDPWLSTPMLSASGKPWGSGEARRAGESPADKALTHSSGLLLRCQPLSRPLLHPEVPLGKEEGGQQRAPVWL